ncbi:SMI1/KNR4 family protein [Runella sp. MFBS21]|uniref:SMI1/KNR4 family protein n=1 Tax=Runella sp. MFBS21 TaxID=3034018 RepID=UPI0023F6FB6F|nr:SMI1/KNR4 family protein [Runella sp. MFBS21]MDF7822268.1 SMI1/KNR4 family protein [Runella sp. MFBS21]
MEKLITELLKFSNDTLEIGEPIKDQRIKNFELYRNLEVPSDFKQFIKKMNGLTLMGTEVYGFDPNKANSIENIYYREHFEVKIPQYSWLIPFSPDGRGNFYCLDTINKLENGNYPIVFWVSNYEYSEIDTPEITHNNFLDWLQEVVIDWTLEYYNYDGSEK